MTERETTIQSMADENTFTFYFSELKWINKIIKMSIEHPKDVIIQHIEYDDKNQEKNYSITAEISKKYIKISPPRKRILTDEQKIQLVERLKQARNR